MGFSLLSRIAGYDENDGAMFPEKTCNYVKTGKKPNITGPEIKLPYSDVYNEVLYILGFAEISSNLSRYDGIKFGYRASNFKNLEELYIKTRTEAFGLEAKLAAIMGCMLLSQDNYARYYDKAMKLRRLIKESLSFDKYDVTAIPVDCPLAALTGLPSLTFSHNGTGFQLMADAKNESALLAAWESFQQ
jgi:aspartyl-tRNA(Asn)/glutamyl-tRNA(Gln) amidotransferase subunit A